MYTKKNKQAIYHALPALRKTFTASLNADNDHVRPSKLHPDPPLIGTTWNNGRYVLVDVKQVNRESVADFFYDSFGSVHAYDPQYADLWFIIDEENKYDGNGKPIVFEYPFGWNQEDINTLNDEFFTYETIRMHLNNTFVQKLNRLRSDHDLDPVEVDETLYEGSILRTTESSHSNYVHPEHIRPDGSKYHTAFQYRNEVPASVIGENQVAMPYNGNAYTLLNPAVIDFAMEEWKNSPDHLENLLYEDYTKVYITVQINKYSPWIKDERTAFFTPSIYVTAHFAIE